VEISISLLLLLPGIVPGLGIFVAFARITDKSDRSIRE